jgi:lysophospholipase L1-like esterase
MKPHPLKRALLTLAAACIGICAAALMAELLVLSVVGEQGKFPRRVVAAPWGLRYNEPGAAYRHKSGDGTWQFKINGQGMRANRDYRYEKPAGVRRVVVIGDSFAIGYEVNVEQTFAMVLERELEKRHPHIEVLNAGVSGYSTAEAALYLERELIKYDPDVVVSSFYENDFADNVRADLFRLDGATLVAGNDGYVPAGRLGDFLNSSGIFNVLSERSNAFAFAKERLTRLAKAVMERRNAPEADEAASNADIEAERRRADDYQRRLLAAILDRMYAFLHARRIPLVILSIPQTNSRHELLERFPHDLVDVTRPGLTFVSGEQVIRPYERTHVLYHRFSLNHWTPIAHDAAGKALARLPIWDETFR